MTRRCSATADGDKCQGTIHPVQPGQLCGGMRREPMALGPASGFPLRTQLHDPVCPQWANRPSLGEANSAWTWYEQRRHEKHALWHWRLRLRVS